MSRTTSKFSLQEFLDLPASNERYELVDGEIRRKMSPKYKHSTIQLRLLLALNQWCDRALCGRVRPEWGVVLQKRGQDWFPVPDITYISYEKLPVEWEEDEPCPHPPELVIEIISPGQTFGEAESWGERFPSPKLFKIMTQKATDYLLAGVDRVWVVDTKAQSVTVFGNNELPQTIWSDRAITDILLSELSIPVASLFTQVTG